MISFKQFLAEAPFNDPNDSYHFNDLDGEKGDHYDNDLAPKMRKKFDMKFKELGKGSSRVAFLAPIDCHMFKAEDLEKLTIKDTGQVSTVFKLALNNKGVFQNKVEMQVWNQAKKMNLAKYLCPIIDWAGNPAYKNNIKYEINDFSFSYGKETGPVWIQMPEVDMNKHNYRKACEQEFGSQDFMSIIEEDDAKINSYFDKNMISKDQYNNAIDLKRLVDYFEISDDIWGENVGVYKGKPIILDYGFDSDTRDIYKSANDGKFLKCTLDKDGVLRMKA